MKKPGNIIWGIILIVLGIILALNAFDITDINIFFRGWWTLFIIVPSINGLITNSEKTWSLIGLIVGVVLLLGLNDFISFDLISKLILPVILIILGISLLIEDNMPKSLKERLAKAEKEDISYAATLGSDKKVCNTEFKGCDVDAIFGSYELDLTKAEIKKDCLIKATSIFGSIKIKVPKDVKVQTISTSILGSTDNDKKKGNDVTVFIKIFNLFGGTKIK